MGPRRYGKSSITLVNPAPPADSLAMGGIAEGEGSTSESQSQGNSSLMGKSAATPRAASRADELFPRGVF